MSTALLPLDSMRCRRCQVILAAFARAIFATRRSRNAQAMTTAADGCAESGSSAPMSDRDAHER
jgi:hypothetical protein